MSSVMYNQDSPAGRVDVRVKLVIGFCMSILAVLVDSIWLLSGLSVVGVMLFLSARPTAGQAKVVGIGCGLLMWGMVFSQALFYNSFPRQVLVQLVPANRLLADGVAIYREGIVHGLMQSLRMIALGLTGYAICFSTRPDRFMRGLLAIRVPYGLAFMAVSAIRLLPIFATEFQVVRQAMRRKGYRPFARGLRATVGTEVASLRPLLAGAIRRSEEMALSIQTRGFRLGGERTSLDDSRLLLGEWLAAGAMLLVTLALVVVKGLFWLYQYQIYYLPELRPVYALVRHWL